jgi:hypothetical protein
MLDCCSRVFLLWAKAEPRERVAYNQDLLLNSFSLVVCLAFLSAYVVCGRVAQGRVLTPFFFIAALTRAGERESYRWRASKVVYYNLRRVKGCE